jgi:hypothetical protein
MAIILAGAPPQTTPTIVFWLLLMWGLGIYPALHFAAWTLPIKTRRIANIAGIAGLAVLVAGFGKLEWPPRHRHHLDQKEWTAFEESLKTQKEPREEILMACPQADEAACIYADQFINIFRDAGWKVQNSRLERVTLARPWAGVVLFKKGTGTIDPNNWRSGLWTKVSPSLLTVRQAFVNIGVEPDEGNDPELGEDLITVYFGMEKPDESARTSLTESMERMTQYQHQGTAPKLP